MAVLSPDGILANVCAKRRCKASNALKTGQKTCKQLRLGEQRTESADIFPCAAATGFVPVANDEQLEISPVARRVTFFDNKAAPKAAASLRAAGRQP